MKGIVVTNSTLSAPSGTNGRRSTSITAARVGRRFALSRLCRRRTRCTLRSALSEPFIQFRGVRKAFGAKVVYSSLDLSVARGEALTVVGGSGVGKSVMLKMLIGLLRPDAGSVRFDGSEVTAMRDSELSQLRQRIAMLFQAGALFDSMTVGENVAYGLEEHFREQMSPQAIQERVAWALDLVGLPGVQPMDPADLSGGMRKRVALARSIAVQPEVVLYDEPTTGLDPINTARVNHLIMGLQKRLKITSIVVTHDMKSAFQISDRIAMVHGGRVIYQGTTAEFRSASDPRISDFIEGRAPVIEDVETLLNA
jgi:phospholipid/cholesterol/gamma-HCH transport system ATP-binding protein